MDTTDLTTEQRSDIYKYFGWGYTEVVEPVNNTLLASLKLNDPKFMIIAQLDGNSSDSDKVQKLFYIALESELYDMGY